MTNADKIRALPNETLAEIMWNVCVSSSCGDCPIEKLCNGIFHTEGDWFDWLESEAEE